MSRRRLDGRPSAPPSCRICHKIGVTTRSHWRGHNPVRALGRSARALERAAEVKRRYDEGQWAANIAREMRVTLRYVRGVLSGTIRIKGQPARRMLVSSPPAPSASSPS